MVMCHHAQIFTRVPGIQIQVLMSKTNALAMSNLPSPLYRNFQEFGIKYKMLRNPHDTVMSLTYALEKPSDIVA